MFIRVWEYDVAPERLEAFLAAYGATGEWARMFSRGSDYLGTSLYRDTDDPLRFVTVDRWLDEASWRSFLDQLGPAYQALDAKLNHLTKAQRLVLEGIQ